MLRRAEGDHGLRKALYTAAGLSVLVWVNTFAWTYRKFTINDKGAVQQCSSIESHVPFVTWAIQDEHILNIERAISEGYDLLTDKSRDMGATWDHVVVFHHQWLFQAERNFLELSRKETAVDTFGAAGVAGSDPGTLFGKHDYINKWLPEWMLPRMHRTKLHMINLQNGSRLDGESANASAGSSDRRTAILLDEMAKMDEGESIKRSTKDVTACRLANSTQNGPGTAFAQWRQSGQIKVFPLMYWDHPEKGLGRHVVENTSYPHLGPWLIRSPWFDIQEKERSPKEVAIEILADPIGSGETYFESVNVEAHRALHAKSCRTRWIVDFAKGVPDSDIPKLLRTSNRKRLRAVKNNKGPLRIWTRLIKNRLDQTKNYVLGIDISKGQGASNSVISVMCVETREKVAEWADANTPPYDLARVACAMALWIGGARNNSRPLVIWEQNGPGWDFGRKFVKTYEYSSYYRDRQLGTVAEKRNKKYGWHSNPDKKKVMLNGLRRAYAHGGFINHSTEALDEALLYIYYRGGGVGPACLVEESASARKTHGDRVIADGLCLWAVDEAPRGRKTTLDMPGRCMERRRRDRLREKKQRAQRDEFDWRNERTHYARKHQSTQTARRSSSRVQAVGQLSAGTTAFPAGVRRPLLRQRSRPYGNRAA